MLPMDENADYQIFDFFRFSQATEINSFPSGHVLMFFSSRLATKINMEVTNDRGIGIVNDEKLGFEL